MKKAIYSTQHATFLRLLVELRAAMSVTQIQLASRLGITQGRGEQIRGRTDAFGYCSTSSLANALGTPLDIFFPRRLRKNFRKGLRCEASAFVGTKGVDSRPSCGSPVDHTFEEFGPNPIAVVERYNTVVTNPTRVRGVRLSPPP